MRVDIFDNMLYNKLNNKHPSPLKDLYRRYIMLDISTIEVFRDSLIKTGFRREFIEKLNNFAVLTLYDLWDVEDDE